MTKLRYGLPECRNDGPRTYGNLRLLDEVELEFLDTDEGMANRAQVIEPLAVRATLG